MITVTTPLFRLGEIVATPGASDALELAQTSPWEFLCRHVSGDFGEVDSDDRQSNLDAIQDDERILSAYTLNTGERIWIITEADRSSSCLLLPDEF